MIARKDSEHLRSENITLRKRVRSEQAELESQRKSLGRLQKELDQLRTLYINTVEHATTLENELFSRLSEKNGHKKGRGVKRIPVEPESERMQVELAEKIEENSGLKRELTVLRSQLEELKTLYVNTVEHSTNIENELDEKYHEVEQLSITDILTGAVNRTGFEKALMDQLNRAAADTPRLSLIMFDIDHFKEINDRFGHDVGDAVLKRIVEIAGKEVRSDDLIARWGGEEFVVIVPGVGSSRAVGLAERIRVKMEAEVHPDAGQVTCSFGVSEVRAGEEVKEVFKRVDSALYHSKNEGRNRVTEV